MRAELRGVLWKAGKVDSSDVPVYVLVSAVMLERAFVKLHWHTSKRDKLLIKQHITMSSKHYLGGRSGTAFCIQNK